MGDYRAWGPRNLRNWIRKRPDERPLWILYDAYQRQSPHKQAASFYLALEWLHGEDPWVRQAVADFRARTQEITLPAADELLEKLKGYAPVRWPVHDPKAKDAASKVIDSISPGAVECAIHNLTVGGQYDKARELALRYHALAVQSGSYPLCSHANHLIHLVEQAQSHPPAGPAEIDAPVAHFPSDERPAKSDPPRPDAGRPQQSLAQDGR